MDFFTAAQRHGEARLPSGLLDVYVQYKQDTRAIIGWLLSHGPSKYRTLPRLSIKDLFGLVNSVRAKAVEMPDTIAFQFRQAIAARSRLSKVFRQLKGEEEHLADTENHEFFTDSLQKMYTDLCECCARPKEACVHQHCDHISAADLDSCRYRALEMDSMDLDGETLEAHLQAKDNAKPLGEDIKAQELKTVPAPTLVDDHLGVAFEAYQLVQEMVALTSTLLEVWEQAARGEMLLVTATALTNTTFALCEGLEQRLAASCEITDPFILRKACSEANEVLVPMTSDGPLSSVDHLTQALQECWQATLHLKSHSLEVHFENDVSNPGLPSQITLAKGSKSSVKDAECRRVMLHNIARCISSRRLRNTLIRAGTPVYTEVGFVLTREDAESQSMRTSTGLHILLESYKAYAFTISPQSSSLCRLQTLRVAQAAIPSMTAVLNDATMPCRCHGTLAYHLENLKLDFEGYLKEKQFDLFFQSPWVCGCHILEMLHALNYYGLRLFAYRGYIGSVLHMYNALRCTTSLDAIPLLDDIGNNFNELVFPGGRPTRSFRASYVRYFGGRLKFHSKRSSHQSGCHELAIPAHTAKATAGFTPSQAHHDARFDCGRLSLLFRLKDRDYHLKDKLTEHILASSSNATNKSPRLNTPKKRKSACRRASGASEAEATPTNILRNLPAAVLPELSGDFPLAKLNLFRIYLLCANIINKVSDRHHGPDSKPGQYCLCCAEVLLESADRTLQSKKWPSKELKELVKIVRETLLEETGKVRKEELVWEHVV